MYDYLIVGSGLYGAIIARLAKDAGKKVLVLEKRNHIGGNIYTEKIEGINVHKYGAHIFHTSDKEVFDFVGRYCELKSFINSPVANFEGKIYNLPFNMNTFYQLFGVITPQEAKDRLKKETHKYKDIEPKNLKEQALKLVGDTIFKTLIEGYTKKQWGRELEQLPADIINRLPIRYTYNNNYFNDEYQAVPKQGYTSLIENLLCGVEVRLNTDYLTLNANEVKAEKIIYTGKIDEFFDYCFGKLEYRSLKFDEKILDCENFQGNAVVNYTSDKVAYTRVIEHKHFSDDESEKTVVTYEYPLEYSQGAEAYYPINNSKNMSIYNKYKSMAKAYTDIHFGGRLGTYSYLDMDKIVRKALDFAKEEGIYEVRR